MLYYIEIFLDSWLGKVSRQKAKNIYTCSGGRRQGSKILVRPVGVFLFYSGDLCSHILQNMLQFICREGQLTHLFFPGRVGRGYGPDWTLAVVSPALSVVDR